ncbi:hypothetical protein B0I35DRAFT_479865 [Stachybotrys elegans]|uniref:Fungal N-terminal domain-containing protein n=1 Tax=Stachybotrys elegans TaxID=80388 RepID=A0A8K0STW9_9HYPO|nr:hypothetical protein B0I35DRAFT_479865 [Stachybotrys elegans]
MDILGAVAAGLQLSGLAIKGSIKGLQVLKSLKEVPQQIQNLRDHLDKEHKSISRLVHSDSSLFHHLSADQYGRISLPATRALRAIEDIQALLEPFDSLLQNTTEHGLRGGASRAHKRFLALYKEKDIETKLGDLDRLRDCLNSELQFSVLETQLQTHQTIGAIDRNVSTTQSTIAQIQSSQSHALLQLDKLDAIQRDLRVYESSLHGVNELMPSVLEIRGMMMTFMSQQSASQDGQPSTNQASEFDLDTRRGTARLSTSLIPPSDDVYRDTTDISLPRRRQSRCRCGRIQPEIRWKLGRTKFLMNTGSHANCPVHGKRRSWGVSLEMRLSHFLRGRLALNLGLTCGSMGWEIPIPLKFSAAVERSKSPIFRLLDDLIAKNCTIYKLGNDAEWHSNHEGGKFGLFFGDDSEARFLQWEAAADSSSLASLVQNVKEVVRSGEALGNEYDEAGSNFFTVSPTPPCKNFSES